MTKLQRLALARLPMPVDDVEMLYDLRGESSVVRSLCESHERLRAEFAGAEVLLADREAEAGRLRLEIVGHEKAGALMNAGMGSLTERYDDLKHENRRLRAALEAVEMAAPEDRREVARKALAEKQI